MLKFTGTLEDLKKLGFKKSCDNGKIYTYKNEIDVYVKDKLSTNDEYVYRNAFEVVLYGYGDWEAYERVDDDTLQFLFELIEKGYVKYCKHTIKYVVIGQNTKKIIKVFKNKKAAYNFAKKRESETKEWLNANNKCVNCPFRDFYDNEVNELDMPSCIEAKETPSLLTLSCTCIYGTQIGEQIDSTEPYRVPKHYVCTNRQEVEIPIEREYYQVVKMYTEAE